MAMDGLTSVVDIGGNGNGGWGDWGGALIGGAIGGAVGSAWGDRRGNNCCNNGGGCCNNGGNTAAFGETFIMDSLSGARSDINSIGRDNLMQTAGVQNALCQGFGGVNATVERTALGQQITATQGFSGLNTAILTSSMQGQLAAKDAQLSALAATNAAEMQGLRNTFELKSSIDNCCCTTQRSIDNQGCQTRETILAEGCATRGAIHQEGEATRALIAQIDRERLLREMNAKDAEIASLKAQNFNTALANNNAAQTRADMQSMLNTILNHMTYKTPTTSGGGTTA